MNAIPLRDVVSVLNAAKIRYVLVGAYGLAGWMKKPRATEDVDVVVATRHQKKAIKILAEAFPHLIVDDQPIVTRLRDPETHIVLIDVIKPFELLYQQALKESVETEIEGQKVRVPTLEMALALKFAPMISLHRADERKHQDAHDFILMVKVNAQIDLEKLSEFGELVYPAGGKELVEKVRQVRAGERLRL